MERTLYLRGREYYNRGTADNDYNPDIPCRYCVKRDRPDLCIDVDYYVKMEKPPTYIQCREKRNKWFIVKT